MLEMQILRLTTLLDAPPTAKESSKVSSQKTHVYNIDFIWFHGKMNALWSSDIYHMLCLV